MLSIIWTVFSAAPLLLRESLCQHDLMTKVCLFASAALGGPLPTGWPFMRSKLGGTYDRVFGSTADLQHQIGLVGFERIKDSNIQTGNVGCVTRHQRHTMDFSGSRQKAIYDR